MIVWIGAVILAVFGMERGLADNNDIRTAIEARYAQMKAAMASHDFKALRAILAPNFVSTDTSDKNESADAMIAAVSSMPTDPNRISKITLLSVQRNDAGVVVEQHYEMNTIKTGNDGVEHTIGSRLYPRTHGCSLKASGPFNVPLRTDLTTTSTGNRQSIRRERILEMPNREDLNPRNPLGSDSSRGRRQLYTHAQKRTCATDRSGSDSGRSDTGKRTAK